MTLASAKTMLDFYIINRLQPVISDLVVIRSELEEPEDSNISPQDCCP
jgi:hypothetical protein